MIQSDINVCYHSLMSLGFKPFFIKLKFVYSFFEIKTLNLKYYCVYIWNKAQTVKANVIVLKLTVLSKVL